MPAFSVLALLMALFSAPSPVSAVESEGGKKATVSAAAHKVLTEAQALIGKQKPREAIEKLDALLPTLAGEPYALAITHQVMAYAYGDQDDYRHAVESFKKALSYQALPDEATHDLTYNVAQLLVHLEAYQEALGYLEEWLRHERDPKLDAVKLAATAHFQLHRYEAAVPYLEKVLARQRPPEEAWYQMLLACHFERGQYQAAVGLLENMVKTWPERRDYWLQWSGAYQRLDQNHQALAVLELAERRGLLGEAERLQLVRLYAYLDMPYQAAEFLSVKIEQGAIKTNLDVWDLLAHSWAHAQEKQRAVRALENAGRLASDGNRYLHIAQLLFELRDWNGAVQAVDNALQKGDIKQAGTAHLLLGIASHHTGDEKRCLHALERAQRYQDTKAQADWWIEKLRAESVAATDAAPQAGM
ncbi:MAG: tetratricopeptide repeat protein [Pseudomonadota bacterium]|nr:tetratricopeptide repeat protein [Pseudomonadota bacterium]